MHANNKSAGITFIELLTVVAILAILATIITPSFTIYLAKVKVNEAYIALEEYKTRTIKLIALTGTTTPTSTAILYPDGDNTGYVNDNNKTVTNYTYVDRVSAYIISGSVLLGARLLTSGAITATNNYVYIAYVNNQWICGLSATKTNDVNPNLLPINCTDTLP